MNTRPLYFVVRLHNVQLAPVETALVVGVLDVQNLKIIVTTLLVHDSVAEIRDRRQFGTVGLAGLCQHLNVL